MAYSTTGSFPVQSGNLNYEFDFSVVTGESPWAIGFGYHTGDEKLFSAPKLNQVITGTSGFGGSLEARGSDLLIGNTSGQEIETYENLSLLGRVTPNIYGQTNTITGNGPTGLSGLGYSISFTDSIITVGSPFAIINGSSGAGAVQVFKSFASGGAGVTGTGSYGFMTHLTGSQASGNFGKSLSSTRSTLVDFLSVGAPGENNGSGSVHIYELNSLNFVQSLDPTGDQIENFGKNSEWVSQLGIEFLAIGYDQGGSGKMDMYKQDSNLNDVFYYFQTLEPPRGAQSGDMFAYSIDEGDGRLFVGAPKIDNSGAVFEYTYNAGMAAFEVSQDISGSYISSGNNFGKNLSFGNINGVITSDKNFGEAYVYAKSGDLWDHINTLSGSENSVSGSFGGDLSGSHVTKFEGGNLIIGSSSEPYTYIYNTGSSVIEEGVRVYISGSGGKLFDSQGNFIYGYSPSQTIKISGNIFTGGNSNIFVNNTLCVTSSPRLSGPINMLEVTNQNNFSFYEMRIFSD